MTTIREAEPRDAGAVADILAGADDSALHSPAGWLHDLRSTPERARALSLVAEAEGVVAGFGAAGLDWSAADPREAFVWVGVAPARRGSGIGRALYERGVAHARSLRAARARTLAREDGPGPAWAARRGWAPIRTAFVVGVDVERRDERADARSQPAARLRAGRTAARARATAVRRAGTASPRAPAPPAR